MANYQHVAATAETRELIYEIAQTRANRMRQPQSVWLAGPNRYQTDTYKPGDETHRDSFLLKVEPCAEA